MVKRLVDRFAEGEWVEIYFSSPYNRWQPGRVLRHDHPGLWVETADGRFWFVTNSRRIRRPESAPNPPEQT